MQSTQTDTPVQALQYESTLTCPRCGHQECEAMATDSCHWFYECKGCHALLRPLPGDCCVFCSYGTVPCPPIQKKRLEEQEAARA